MKAPISFTYGNCLFGAAGGDAWAAFAVAGCSYEWLAEDAKHGLFASLRAALEAVQADVQILRVARSVSPRAYLRGYVSNDGQAHTTAARAYAQAHARRLCELEAWRPRVFLLVSLREPVRDIASQLSSAAEREPREWLRTLAGAISWKDRQTLSVAELGQVQEKARQAQGRLGAYLPVRPASPIELQWLVRRAFCRGLGEPALDRLHEPRALLAERDGRPLLAHLGDVKRWMDGVVEERGRLLRVQSELGESWQAQLVLGALPERSEFPGPAAELMFAPIESVPFGVDASLNARFVPNELAVRLVRRRLQDADQIVRAEAGADQGISHSGCQRAADARELLSQLQAAGRPPLLRCSLALAVWGVTETQVQERVERCRHAFGEIRLHRPMGEQLSLFLQHLPGQRARVRGYDDTLTCEQVAAMMPIAVHSVGARSGFYLGHTLSGSRQPVRFNLREGSEHDRNTTILSVGALGSGKTTLAQKLKYEAFIQGARIVDCDPKGDHRFHLLEEVAPHAQTISLRPQAALRGMLDPLRIAPEHLRQDLTVSFLCDLLPSRAEAGWETAVVVAVDRVMRRSAQPTCMEVVKALLEGDDGEAQVGRALEVYARSGLTQLGFADPGRAAVAVEDRQVIYIPIRDLPGPQPDTPRSQYTQAERIGVQMVRLIAMFAMSLMARERERLKLFCFDEGWRVLGDPVGRMLLASLQRMGRSELAVPLISTQLVSDALIGERESLENLIGATFVFGMRSPGEAARALKLLGLDAEDPRAQQRLLELQAGRCLLRDHAGRIEAVQVDVVCPRLLRAFSTTPQTAA